MSIELIFYKKINLYLFIGILFSNAADTKNPQKKKLYKKHCRKTKSKKNQRISSNLIKNKQYAINKRKYF